MDAKFNSLPPLKRFRLLQQQQQEALSEPKPEPEPKPIPKSVPLSSKSVPLSPSNLPAKKRKYSRDPFFDSNEEKENLPPITPPTPFCLPAKKRIWAFKPEFIDLNLEYDPSVESEGVIGEEKLNDDDDVEEEEDDGILCAVCESTDGDPSDPIVFCDGCELMVHSTCYGNPLVKGVPEGEWFCAHCSKSQPSAHKCCLCPVTGGAMKATSDGQWAHIVCAVLVPEVFFEDPEGRDGINCSKVPKRRWRDRCYLCKKNKGCAIQCSEPKCPLAFHVTCGLKDDLCIELKEGKNSGGVVAAFCKKHTELWKKQKQTGKFKIVARDEEHKF